MTKFDFDLFVIGGGSGGVRAARIAAGHGARVAIAEEYRFGGTCVIRGCVPKKLLVYASRFDDAFEDARGFGWTVGEARFDWAALIAAKDKEIARLEGLYRAGLERAGAAIFAERATVIGPQAVRLDRSGKTVTARTILIATGARPSFDPVISGSEHAITSNEAFDLAELPERIVILGGGYIAVEFASIFNGLGSEVTLVVRRDKVLRGFDEDLRDGLGSALGQRGIRVVTGVNVAAIERDREQRKITLTDGTQLTADHIMLATGRIPNTVGIGLDTLGVKVGALGEIIVDDESRSSVPSIYAVGDVTNRANLTPVAIREGHAFADTVFGQKSWLADHSLIPTAVFSTPEIGTIGLSEAAARATGNPVDIYKTAFRPMMNSLAGRDERTVMKLVVDGTTDVVLGVHILGPDAAEIVQMAAIALRLKATKDDFDRTMALHPSAAEELVTLRDKWVPPAG